MTKVKIKTLTPVHIGSGVDLQSNIEYLFINDKIGVIDDKKVLQVIGEENINRWVSIINSKDNLLDYLRKRKNDIKLSDVALREMDVYASDIGKNKTLKEQLHSAKGFPMIPGSSIKGAIRTTVISYLIEKETDRVKNIINKKRSFLNSKGRKWDLRSFQEVESEILNQLLSNSFKPDANRNVFRFLQVTDSHFNYNTLVTNMQVLNLQNNEWRIKNGTDQLTEIIGNDNEAEIRIKINSELLNRNLNKKEIKSDVGFLKDIQSLFEIVNNHTKLLIQKEIDIWGKMEKDYPNELIDWYLETLNDCLDEAESCKENEAVIRIGGGSGWDNITGAWAKHNKELFNDNEWEKLSNLLNKNRKVSYFPKTRKIDESGDVLGFIKLTALQKTTNAGKNSPNKIGN
ncbi:MAG: type III-A CRISPR-associated RAMP protein Csm5 [Bacteroidota bacterium]|nr:type III-A CRISPR-associated RAMP protein Csm5 [Bacteroidota bacterium]